MEKDSIEKGQIEELTALLTQKGYRSMFSVGNAETGYNSPPKRLTECLMTILVLENNGKHPARGWIIKTNLVYDTHISCVFQLSYDPRTGFKISSMDIINSKENETKHFNLRNNHEVQGASSIPALFPKKPLWKRRFKGLRIFFLCCGGLLVTTVSNAQGLGGIFSQNDSQRKYLLEQIAALKVYSGYATKGYSIVKDGSGLIGDIKKGQLDIHKGYFDGLKAVNPEIRRYKRIDDIIRIQEMMHGNRQVVLSNVAKSSFFSNRETSEINRLYSNMSREAEIDLEELMSVVTPGRISMSDDERIDRINKIYSVTLSKYALQQRLNSKIMALAASREQKLDDLKMLRKLE